MKERILTGWNYRRVIYVLLGGFLMVQSVIDEQWIMVAFGGYFAAMGIFSFGCAGGNCAVGPTQRTNKNIEDIEFEEIKNKNN